MKNNEDHRIPVRKPWKMTDFIKKGDDPNTAWEKAKGQYGRVEMQLRSSTHEEKNKGGTENGFI